MDYAKLTDDVIEWIKKWFNQNGYNCNAVVGVSGGTKSAIILYLMCNALGKDRVKAVIMRATREDDDIKSINIANSCGVEKYIAPIFPAINAMKNVIDLDSKLQLKEKSLMNFPARIRMATLYAISQSINGRVINTSCLSDNYIGNVTIWGDSCGDMSPFGLLTLEEIRGIGAHLLIPNDILYLDPDDHLPNSKPDEVKFGIKYADLDHFIRTGEIKSDITKNRIRQLYVMNRFKHYGIDTFNPNLEIHTLQ